MRLLIRLVGLLVIVCGVAVISLLFLPSERIAVIAADQISKQTGRKVTLEGETKLTFWPILGVSTERFTIANADWSDLGPMLTAQNLKIGVEAQALWGGEVRITGLEARYPEILLERASDGRVNWELGVDGIAPSGLSGTDASATSTRLALTLDRALIEDAGVTFHDHASGQKTHLWGIDLDLRWPDYDGTATFSGSLNPLGGLARKFTPTNQKIQFTGQLDKVGAFIEGELTTLDARIEAPGGSLSFLGRASASARAEGKLGLRISDAPGFLTAFGVEGVEMPAGLGQGGSLDTLLSVSDATKVALREADLSLGGNRVTGAADLDFSAGKPRISAQVRAGALDLSRLAGADSAAQTGAGSGVVDSGWSKAPIDASALSLVDGEFALVAESVNLGKLKLGKTRTKATLDRARLVFSIAELQLYDGSLTGEFVVNNRSGLSVGGALAATGLNIQSLLRDAIGVSRLTGTAAADLKFLGVGQSMDAIMNSLSGSGSVKTGRGVIEGFDLDRLMRAGDLTGGTTVFDTLSASYTIDKGQMRNDDLRLSMPLASADGAGRIGLGARDIDYLFTPRLLQGDTRAGLAIPVSIKGPWADPRIKPDLEKAVDLNFKEERQEIEQKAKNELTRAVEKELGVTVEEGQSLEDAIKQEIENKAVRGILKLLD